MTDVPMKPKPGMGIANSLVSSAQTHGTVFAASLITSASELLEALFMPATEEERNAITLILNQIEHASKQIVESDPKLAAKKARMEKEASIDPSRN